MPFLSPNQQRQSIQGTNKRTMTDKNYSITSQLQWSQI